MGEKVAGTLLENGYDPAEEDRMNQIDGNVTSLTPFIGREEELAVLSQMLGREEVRLVTLTGPGGTGKTRLVLQAANAVQAAFNEGVCFIDLTPIDDPALVAITLATGLGVYETTGQSVAQMLFEYLSQREILLVIDNFEHLLAEADMHLLSDILASAPGVKILVTSREALNLKEEWRYPVGGMPYPRKGENIAGMETFGAVQLFAANARRVRPDFSLEREGAQVAHICQLVEGMPLAIELAAAWTKTLHCAEIASEIQRNLDFLATSLRNVPERHRSMQAIFERSWDALNEKQQDGLKILSIFRGGFDRLAAGQVAGASLSILSALLDKSLLRRREDGRYQIHELLRQFAREKMAPEEKKQAQDAHCDYYADFLEQRLPDMLGGRQREATAEIGAELENLRAAWQWAVENTNVDFLYRSTESLALFDTFRNRYLESRAALEQADLALSNREGGRTVELARLRIKINLAWIYLRLGQLDQAETLCLQVRDSYRQLQQPPIPGQGSDPDLSLGVLALIKGDYATAVHLGSEALKRSEQHQHLSNRQFACYVVTRATLGQGEYEAAGRYAQEAYRTSQRVGDRWFMAYCLNELGNVALAQQSYNTARTRFESSFAIREEFKDLEGMALALGRMGDIALQQQEYREALSLFSRSVAIYQEINDRGGWATALNGLGYAAVKLGDYRMARDQFRQALQSAADIQYVSLILSLIVGISELLHRLGRPEQSVEWLAFVVDHPASEEETKARARSLLEPHRLALTSGQTAAAIQRGRDNDLGSVIRTALDELAKPVAAVEPAHEMDAPGAASLLADPLTPRELEVLKLIADGMSNRQIAAHLVIALGTVKSYTNQIYTKLYVTSRTQAVARARQLGLISP